MATISGIFLILEGSDSAVSTLQNNREITWARDKNAFRYVDCSGVVHYIGEGLPPSGSTNYLVYKGASGLEVDPNHYRGDGLIYVGKTGSSDFIVTDVNTPGIICNTAGGTFNLKKDVVEGGTGNNFYRFGSDHAKIENSGTTNKTWQIQMGATDPYMRLEKGTPPHANYWAIYLNQRDGLPTMQTGSGMYILASTGGSGGYLAAFDPTGLRMQTNAYYEDISYFDVSDNRSFVPAGKVVAAVSGSLQDDRVLYGKMYQHNNFKFVNGNEYVMGPVPWYDSSTGYPASIINFGNDAVAPPYIRHGSDGGQPLSIYSNIYYGSGTVLRANYNDAFGGIFDIGANSLSHYMFGGVSGTYPGKDMVLTDGVNVKKRSIWQAGINGLLVNPNAIANDPLVNSQGSQIYFSVGGSGISDMFKVGNLHNGTYNNMIFQGKNALFDSMVYYLSSGNFDQTNPQSFTPKWYVDDYASGLWKVDGITLTPQGSQVDIKLGTYPTTNSLILNPNALTTGGVGGSNYYHIGRNNVSFSPGFSKETQITTTDLRIENSGYISRIRSGNDGEAISGLAEISFTNGTNKGTLYYNYTTNKWIANDVNGEYELYNPNGSGSGRWSTNGTLLFPTNGEIGTRVDSYVYIGQSTTAGNRYELQPGAGQIISATTDYTFNMISNEIHMFSGGFSKFRFVNDKLGIAQPSPQYQIDVNGDINCTGVYRVNGIPVGEHTSVVNPTGYLYVYGDADTDGSIRFNMNTSGNITTIQRRDGGAWNATAFEAAADTFLVGKRVGIASAGRYIITEDIDGESRFHANSEFDGQLTRHDAQITKIHTYESKRVIQPDSGNLFTGTSFGYTYPASINTMAKYAYFHTGPTAATQPVRGRIWEGTGPSGLLGVETWFPASEFPANTEIRITFDGYYEFEAGVTYYVEWDSPANFSMRTNTAATLPWFAVDALEFRKDDMLQTKDYISGDVFDKGQWTAYSGKIYSCDVSGVQTGDFISNIDKWSPLVTEYSQPIFDSLSISGNAVYTASGDYNNSNTNSLTPKWYVDSKSGGTQYWQQSPIHSGAIRPIDNRKLFIGNTDPDAPGKGYLIASVANIDTATVGSGLYVSGTLSAEADGAYEPSGVNFWYNTSKGTYIYKTPINGYWVISDLLNQIYYNTWYISAASEVYGIYTGIAGHDENPARAALQVPVEPASGVTVVDTAIVANKNSLFENIKTQTLQVDDNLFITHSGFAINERATYFASGNFDQGNEFSLTPKWYVDSKSGGSTVLKGSGDIAGIAWSANTNYTDNITVTGAEVGDTVVATVSNAFIDAHVTAGSTLTIHGYVTSANTVYVWGRNTAYTTIGENDQWLVSVIK